MNDNTFNLSDFLPYRLTVLASRVSKRLSAVYEREYGLTMPEWRVIAHLGRCPKVSVRDFHHCVNMEKPRVSRAIAKLEKAGLVEKTASETDHRLIEVALTPEGWKILNGIIPEALAFEHALLTAWTDDETRQFVNLMERLHSKLDADGQSPRRSRMDLPQ